MRSIIYNFSILCLVLTGCSFEGEQDAGDVKSKEQVPSAPDVVENTTITGVFTGVEEGTRIAFKKFRKEVLVHAGQGVLGEEVKRYGDLEMFKLLRKRCNLTVPEKGCF